MPRWSFTHTLFVVIAAVGLAGCPPVLPDPAPVANFSATPRSGNTGLAVAFSNLSTAGAGGAITSWQWNFGDGARSSEPNPTHTYLAAGSFDVSLTVTSSGGSHT
ncbi:MAG: PKD domain-containing protein, partial [Gammaproteobacteria bacterium]|nr:PKD domain-containing protein [Gammaproteobacteria bacterium]